MSAHLGPVSRRGLVNLGRKLAVSRQIQDHQAGAERLFYDEGHGVNKSAKTLYSQKFAAQLEERCIFPMADLITHDLSHPYCPNQLNQRGCEEHIKLTTLTSRLYASFTEEAFECMESDPCVLGRAATPQAS